MVAEKDREPEAAAEAEAHMKGEFEATLQVRERGSCQEAGRVAGTATSTAGRT
jgi:hypothetical protein